MQGDTVIQNNCTLYSCRIMRGVYVGHNSVIMEGAILEEGCIVAPNSVVPPGRVVKSRQVWGGNPIKYIRKTMEQEAFVSLDYCRQANDKGEEYTTAFLPYSNAYLYRQGPTEVAVLLLSRSTSTSTSTSSSSTGQRTGTNPTKPPSIAMADAALSKYHPIRISISTQ